jgi:phenylacetate-coenzyme A ligase PaaK-like adenylate-forming protein
VFRTVKNLLRLYSRFRQTRDLAQQLKTPDDVWVWQSKMLGPWLKDQAKHLPHFRPYAGLPLEAWPIMDKSGLMSSFGHYNRAGISTGAAWSMFDGRTRPRSGYYVGGSTGTSGNRGLYVITEDERMDWLGVTLAKTLPRFPADSARIALLLPNYSPLYKFPRYGPIDVKFFDLSLCTRHPDRPT